MIGAAPLQERWFARPAPQVARALIGTTLTWHGCGGMVVETEAYTLDDPASHSHGGPTARNAAMFGPPGRAYVYRSYGIHLCLNVTCGHGQAVLIRALAPGHGLATMTTRRGTDRARLIASGPGRLGQALGVTLADNHCRFDSTETGFLPGAPASILTGPRIGITRAKDRPWRFGLAGSPHLSRAFPAAPSFCRKYSGG